MQQYIAGNNPTPRCLTIHIVLVNEYGSSELEELLDSYISQGSYYYNIVTWLDRLLYSKGQYHTYYKSTLSSMIEEN
jgi:hypothetical protein